MEESASKRRQTEKRVVSAPTYQSGKLAKEVLIVDDEPYICELLVRFFSNEEYRCTCASNGTMALGLVAGKKFDLVVSDVSMPGMSGIDLLKTLKSISPDMAVIMMTGIDDHRTALLALQLGAYGYLFKPLDQNELLISAANALERRRMMLLMKEYERNLEQKVRERTAHVRQREEEIVLRLLSAAGYRDDETGAHVRRIGLYSSRMAQELGWELQAVDDMRLAAPMHDVGKIGIPDSILQKPGKLTLAECEVMKTHTEIGARILASRDIPLLQLAGEIAMSHHEQWDGSGYPHGISGEAIPESGRIVAVVDVYDALVYDRVYRAAVPEDKVISMMAEKRGTHFDPRILDCFFSILTDIRRIRQEIQDQRLPTLSGGIPQAGIGRLCFSRSELTNQTRHAAYESEVCCTILFGSSAPGAYFTIMNAEARGYVC